jgi:hypothetical protein
MRWGDIQIWCIWSAKNKGLDITISIVLYLVLKLFFGLDKLGAKESDKKTYLCFSLNHEITFFPQHMLSKRPNSILSIKYRTRQNLYNTLNFISCYSIPHLYFSDQTSENKVNRLKRKYHQVCSNSK